jgi:hypothetical protein
MLCIAGFRPNGTLLVHGMIFTSQYVLLLPAMLECLSLRLLDACFRIERHVDDQRAARTESMFRLQAIIRCTLQCLILMISLSTASAVGQQSFDNVAGSWSGSGWMKPSDGPRERVRCKVDYSVKSAGQSVKLNLRCASDAYKMELSANIEQTGTTLSGNWFESQYRQGGKISGQNDNGLIEARVEGNTITALLTVRTRANRQSFVMESPGAWVSEVSIDLFRDAK